MKISNFNLAGLSAYQLYGLFTNMAHHSTIRQQAKKEFDSRVITEEDLHIIEQYKKSFNNQKTLPGISKVVLIVFGAALSNPFLFLIHNIITSLMLDKGLFKMQKQYWLYMAISYLIWTFMILFFAKHFFI